MMEMVPTKRCRASVAAVVRRFLPRASIVPLVPTRCFRYAYLYSGTLPAYRPFVEAGGAICSGKARQTKDRFRPLSIARETFSVYFEGPPLRSACLGQSSELARDSASHNAVVFSCAGEGEYELACGRGPGLRERRRRTGSAVVGMPGPDCRFASTFVFRWPPGSRVRNRQGLSGVASQSLRRSVFCRSETHRRLRHGQQLRPFALTVYLVLAYYQVYRSRNERASWQGRRCGRLGLESGRGIH